MPTRPSRRERRRTDRRNTNKLADPVSRIPQPTQHAAPAPGPMPLTIFMNAVPIVRNVMRLILIQEIFTHSQVVALQMLKEVLELEKPRPSAPNFHQHEYQILCFQGIVELCDMHSQELRVLKLQYAEQVIMWGFECSKPEAEWDMKFIARRKLELVQLNRTVRTLAVVLEEELQSLLGNHHFFTSPQVRMFVMGALERFRVRFVNDVEAAVRETTEELKSST